MNEINFDSYGFLNDTWDLDQTNWAEYFSPTIPDGVIGGIGDELEVFADSGGMLVHVKNGECRVRSHRGALSEQTDLTLDAASSVYPRIDLIVARVNYDIPAVTLAVKTGEAAADPVSPTLTQIAGDVWEIALAEVKVAAGATTIASDNITDRRFVYQTGGSAVTNFSGTALTVANDWEYRQASEINSLVITLPAADPSGTWLCCVNFTASNSFTGITFERGGAAYSIKTTDLLKNTGVRYNLSIWWDGSYFWAAAKGA